MSLFVVRQILSMLHDLCLGFASALVVVDGHPGRLRCFCGPVDDYQCTLKGMFLSACGMMDRPGSIQEDQSGVSTGRTVLGQYRRTSPGSVPVGPVRGQYR